MLKVNALQVVLADLIQQNQTIENRNDPLFLKAKADVVQMIEILQATQGHDEAARAAKTRAEVLSGYL